MPAFFLLAAEWHHLAGEQLLELFRGNLVLFLLSDECFVKETSFDGVFDHAELYCAVYVLGCALHGVLDPLRCVVHEATHVFNL